jgi:hypothetical protein
VDLITILLLFFFSCSIKNTKVPLNDKSNLRQRSISIEREEEEGMEGLEEPLKAKKRRESRQGKMSINWKTFSIQN